MEMIEKIEVYESNQAKKICEFESVKDASADMLIPESEIYDALAYGSLVDGFLFVRKYMSTHKIGQIRKKQVAQIDLDGNELAKFDSVAQAVEKTGINNIDKAARGVIRTAGGYVWKYETL